MVYVIQQKVIKIEIVYSRVSWTQKVEKKKKIKIVLDI